MARYILTPQTNPEVHECDVPYGGSARLTKRNSIHTNWRDKQSLGAVWQCDCGAIWRCEKDLLDNDFVWRKLGSLERWAIYPRTTQRWKKWFRRAFWTSFILMITNWITLLISAPVGVFQFVLWPIGFLASYVAIRLDRRTYVHDVQDAPIGDILREIPPK